MELLQTSTSAKNQNKENKPNFIMETKMWQYEPKQGNTNNIYH